MQDHERPPFNSDSLEYALVRFPVFQGPVASEGLWAHRVGKDRYELVNIPGWARGVSLGDIVRVRRDHESFSYRDTWRHGGHSTYTIALQGDAAAAFAEAWIGLSGLGCRYERLSPRMFAVDVPPDADIAKVYRLLEAGMGNGIWWFDELDFGHADGELAPVQPA
jgi:Domain of unknown function (DUF4265)